MASLGHIKGAVIGEFLSWYELRFGPEIIRREIEALAPSHREAFDTDRSGFGLLSSQWYPAELVHDLVDRLISGWSETEQRARAQDAADVVMASTLKGIYRTMFSMIATPRRYARHVHRLWSQHYDSGRLIVEEIGPTSHRVTYEDWASHHPFICRMNMSSAIPVYQAMGCRDVAWTRLRCVSEGAPSCSNVISWRS